MPDLSTNETERHRAALSMLSELGFADADERARRRVEREGVHGQWTVDHIFGEVWSRRELAPRDRAAVAIAAIGTLGESDLLAEHLDLGLRAGLEPDQLAEIVLHLMVYAGLARSSEAQNVLTRVLDERERPRGAAPALDPICAASDAQRRENAVDVLRTLYGWDPPRDPDRVLATFERYTGAIGRHAFEWSFGELWARPRLSRRDRSLVVVAIVSAAAREYEIQIHARGALRHGLSRGEVEEIAVTVAAYGGIPLGLDGLRAMRGVWQQMDDAARDASAEGGG